MICLFDVIIDQKRFATITNVASLPINKKSTKIITLEGQRKPCTVIKSIAQ